MVKKVVKKHPAKHIILAVAIALITVFFIAYAIQSFYPSPEYDDFCPTQFYENKSICEVAGGEWNYPNENIYAPEGKEPVPEPERGYCSYIRCSEEYMGVSEVYERNVFFINLILGIVIVVLSFLLTLEAVSSGFMGGGALLLIYSVIRYWGNLSNIWRTLMLGFTLVVLVIVGYKKLK